MPLTREEAKQAMKEAIQDWLDERYKSFGKWTLAALSSAVFAALIYFILRADGWTKS